LVKVLGRGIRRRVHNDFILPWKTSYLRRGARGFSKRIRKEKKRRGNMKKKTSNNGGGGKKAFREREKNTYHVGGKPKGRQ